ncbi:MAG: ATP-binding protein, partial [Halofilum sp. (in: g-proteobacteria)]
MIGDGDHTRRHGGYAVAFPWPGIFAGLAVVVYLLIASEPRLAAFYDLPAFLLRAEIRYGIVVALALLIWLDVRRVRRRHADQAAELEHRQRQIDDLWARNRQLQLKAHTYSEHADKLKLFISDKLLEYIEYDEKFLHFKGIASEVRHNGVISFDKVQTALQRALADADAHADSTPDSAQGGGDYRAALDALHYLWDLLDLSTAENLTLHIGNLMCECEEQYCQRLLDSDQAHALPDEPAYSPQRAAWRALAMVREEPLPELDLETVYSLDDGRIHARLAPAGELLGKENHLVLLLENLLRNAQFYAAKRGYASPFAQIALTLDEDDGDACLRVYNRGPHIRDEDLPNLFQLGYSTRRRREHHGRGLGLYFVNEIVKGYEGGITVHNIRNRSDHYEVRITLLNGDEIVETVEVILADDKPRCRGAEGDPARHREWTLRSPVQQVTIVPGEDGDPLPLGEFAARGTQEFHDPVHPERPHWRLRYRPKRNANRLEFAPLDINGVEFEVRLPTA